MESVLETSGIVKCAQRFPEQIASEKDRNRDGVMRRAFHGEETLSLPCVWGEGEIV